MKDHTDSSGSKIPVSYSGYTHKISVEPSYYGSECTQEDADRIFEELGEMVQSQFPGIQIERYVDGQGSAATTGPDEAIIEEIDRWVSGNWTAAF